MQEKSKIIKKLFSREKASNRSSKKTEKPWVMQYKWISEEFCKKNSWFGSHNTDWHDHYDKYMDTEHALMMLSKDARSYPGTRLSGRHLQLLNKITGEILPLEIVDKKVIIKS